MSGLGILQWIQSFHTPFLDRCFCSITDLHSANFYILILPLIAWLLDKRFARYMLSVLFLGLWSNDVLKDLFNTARPPEGAVRKLCAETGTGPAFPSGHSQNPLMFWGALALYFRRPWFTGLVALVVFLIGLSRLYLGLHWPLDVLGGWAIGLLMLWGFQLSQSFWTGDRLSYRARLLWAAVIPLGALAVSLATTREGLSPDTWKVLGAYLGTWIGSIIEEEHVGFDPRAGSLLTHVLKIVVGVAVVFAVKEGAKFVLPATAPGDLIRYAFVGVTATLLCPWIFRRFFRSAPPAGRTVANQHNLI